MNIDDSKLPKIGSEAKVWILIVSFYLVKLSWLNNKFYLYKLFYNFVLINSANIMSILFSASSTVNIVFQNLFIIVMR